MDTTVLAAINRSVLIIEVAIGVIIVLLIVGIIVTGRRRKKAAAPKPPQEVPNYYADLQQQPGGRPDPFGTFAAASTPSAPGSAPQGPRSAPTATTATGADLGTFGGATPDGMGSSWQSPNAWQSGGDAWPSGGSAPRAEAAMAEPQSAATTTVAPVAAQPPPGTPAGWLPDPGGAPDTLRYWDGNAWTQHFAQRT
jgi:Protein of unknown function (DUF2510)